MRRRHGFLLTQQHLDRGSHLGVGGHQLGGAGTSVFGIEHLFNHGDNRPVCDALAVGQAGPGQHLSLDAAQKLRCQPGLAHTGRAKNGEQAAGTLAH